MILNLLIQEGIEGRVDGGYLPGGVGELQAINLVRVMVVEADYERAAQVIKDWEAIEVDKEERSRNRSSNGVSIFLIGLVIGGGLIYWAYNSPVTEDGIDMNGDGVLDEKWLYKDNRITKSEVDRNFDGKVAADETRQLVQLPEMMQQHMMSNMRDHLVAINEILINMANGELDKAAEVAESRLGMSSLESHGASYMAKFMPAGMRQAGTSMHRAASRFALKAQEGEPLPAYNALSEVTSACIACHSGYRIR